MICHSAFQTYFISANLPSDWLIFLCVYIMRSHIRLVQISQRSAAYVVMSRFLHYVKYIHAKGQPCVSIPYKRRYYATAFRIIYIK